MTTTSRVPMPPSAAASVVARSSSAAAARGASVVRPLPSGWGVARRRLSRLTIASVALLAVAGVGLFQVLQTTRVAAVGYDVRALEVEQQHLDADIRLLEAQIATTSNLDAMRRDATTRLGMVPAQQRVRVTVDVPAPLIVPLPRRYVPIEAHDAAPTVWWWEELLASVPGLR